MVLDPWQASILHHSLGERPDGRWSAFEVALVVGRQNGKGAVLESRELAGLFLFGEELILHSAHEFKTAAEAFRRVLSLVENTDDLRKKVKKVQIGHGDEGIELRNGNRLRFVARSTGSGRGFSGDLVILDEAYALTGQQVEALLPTMSARTNPQLWYTSSPSLDGESGAQLLDIRDRGRAGDPQMAYFDFGAKGSLAKLSEIDLDDRELWRACNPAFGIRISEEFIARERRAMSDEGFARERLCVWPVKAGGGAVIDPKLWADLADTESKRVGDVALGVDIATQRDYAAIAVYGLREDKLGHAQLVDYRPGTDWIVARLLELKQTLDPVAIGMGRGTGASLETDLEKVGIKRPEDAEKPKRGDLAVTSTTDMAAACGQILDAVRQSTLRYVPAAPLDAAVAGAKTRQSGDTIAWSRRDADSEPSPLVGVTVARWAFESRAHLVSIPYDPLHHIW